MLAVTVHSVTQSTREIDLSEFKDNIQSILRQLEKQGYITQDGNFVVVEHPGFHTLQVSAKSFLKGLWGSMLLPIIVSAVTALITIWLTMWIGS